MVAVLKKRKNKPGGSRLVRTCWCKEDPSTCPLHQLGPWLASKRVGEALFPGWCKQPCCVVGRPGAFVVGRRDGGTGFVRVANNAGDPGGARCHEVSHA